MFDECKREKKCTIPNNEMYDDEIEIDHYARTVIQKIECSRALYISIYINSLYNKLYNSL